RNKLAESTLWKECKKRFAADDFFAREFIVTNEHPAKLWVMHEDAHRYLARIDKRLATLMAASRRYDLVPQNGVRPFDALAESIAYQQLSGKAAATIWKRVRALFPK